jgi:hypothetical protein
MVDLHDLIPDWMHALIRNQHPDLTSDPNAHQMRDLKIHLVPEMIPCVIPALLK